MGIRVFLQNQYMALRRHQIARLREEGNVKQLCEVAFYHRNWAVRALAEEALLTLNRPDEIFEELKGKIYWRDSRERAVRILKKITCPQMVGPLIDLMPGFGENYGLLEGVKEVLVAIGQPAVEELISLFEDEIWQLRKYASKALGEIDDSRAVMPLIAHLCDPGVEKAALDALIRITGENFGTDAQKW